MTTGDDDTTQTVIQLPTNLSQLVDDCFDEEQYDQAVNLLDQLRSRSILPTRTHLAQLFSLSLCSLPERNTLPTFSSSFRSSATSQARLPKTPHSSTRPSPNSILASTLLLRRLSQVVEENVRRGGCDDGGGDGDHDHDPTLIQVSSYISSCLPSHSSVSRPPSLEPSSGKPRSLSAGLHPHSGSDDDHLEENPIQTWTESRFLSSRDVWDLLTCTGQASEHLPSPERILVDEFWMTAKEKVKATNEIKRLRLRTTLPWNRDSRGKRGKRPKLSGSTAKRARGATKVRFEHRKVSSETFPEECSAVSSASVSGEEEEEEKGYPSSPKKRVASNNRGRDDVEEDEDDDLIHGQVELSEGSWRTLDVLVGMWHADMRSRSMSSSSKQGNDSRLEDCSLANQFPKQAQGQPKIFSFGRAKVGRGQSGIKGMGSTEVGKPLDIVFSFHRSLPVTWWGWDEAKDGLDTLDDKVGGSGRPWRCGMVGFDEQDWGNASRAKTAARLLSLLFKLGEAGVLDLDSVIRGATSRIGSLPLRDLQVFQKALEEEEWVMEMSEESEGGRGSSFKPFIKSLFSYLTTSSFDRKKSNSQSKDEVEDRNVSLPLPPGLVRSRPNREVFWSCLRNRCAKSLRATRVMAWLDGRKKSDHWWDFLEGGGVIAATGGSTFGSSKDETRGMVTRGKVKSQGKRPGFDVEEEEEVTGNVKEKEEKEEEEEGGSAEALVYLGEIMMECRVRWNWIKLVILRSGLEGAAALKSLHDGKGGEEEVKILGTLEQFGDHVEDEIRDSNELLARLNKLRMDCERKGKVGRRKGRGGGFFRRNPEGSLSEGEEEREEEGEGEGDGEEMNLLKGFDTSMKRIGEGVESLRGILDSIGMLTSVLGDGKEHVGEVEPEAGGEGLGEGEDGKERVKVEEGGGSDDGDSQDEESESLTPALRCSSSSEVSFLCSQ